MAKQSSTDARDESLAAMMKAGAGLCVALGGIFAGALLLLDREDKED